MLETNKLLIGVNDMGEFGDKIRAERERQGYRLDDVEQETKIRRLYLNALEEEKFDILPPRVYATGFVKRYARFLKMDQNQLLSEFEVLAYFGKEEEEEETEKRSRNKRQFIFPLRNIVAGLVFLIIVIWGGKSLVAYISHLAVEEPPISPPSVVQPNEKQVDDTEMQKNISEREEKISLIIRAKADQRCWLEVSVDGEQEYSSMLNSTEELRFEGQESILVHAGNAGGIDLSLNGNDTPALGIIGEVVDKEFTRNDISKE